MREDPRLLLPVAARRRLKIAHLEGECLKNRALARIESESDSGTLRGDPFVMERDAHLEEAILILKVALEEYQKIGKTGAELHQIMEDEIDQAVYSLELTRTQESLLRTELLLHSAVSPESPLAAAAVDAKTTKATGGRSFGQRIKQLRKREGWSIDALAKKSGLCRDSILDYEAGRSLPRPDNLKALADTFRVPVNELE